MIGLTLRVGRAIHGTIKVIEDLIFSGKSVLLLVQRGPAPPKSPVSRQASLRRLQHEIAEQHGVHSLSVGREPARRVGIYR